jgi:plastocyanin
MRAAALASIALVSTLLLAGPSLAAPEATIRVGDNFLRPGLKTVAKGTKVRFAWVGSARHHIVKSQGPGGPIASPATAKRGVNLARRLTKSGTYRFVCRIHPAEMRLNLVVR